MAVVLSDEGVLPTGSVLSNEPALWIRKAALAIGDTVVGKDHQGFVVTMVERKSLYTLAAQVDTKEALTVAESIIVMLRQHKQVCHTITFDNGKKFAQHQ
jgi:transposase, IS30 family